MDASGNRAAPSIRPTHTARALDDEDGSDCEGDGEPDHGVRSDCKNNATGLQACWLRLASPLLSACC